MPAIVVRFSTMNREDMRTHPKMGMMNMTVEMMVKIRLHHRTASILLDDMYV